ncbi:hypothetical protein BPUM_3165 [Bacillus pumilus SAFR-032]|uniref:Uncharacterized protein n=1 Tax=Bacillus pumilus (strain SAFR-032) TaxID=315750 RepID=A8FHV2_BACP2|nr:hypothetical protein BPUM_3165 [Bacillus pumilus SAFR-032]
MPFSIVYPHLLVLLRKAQTSVQLNAQAEYPQKIKYLK